QLRHFHPDTGTVPAHKKKWKELRFLSDNRVPLRTESPPAFRRAQGCCGPVSELLQCARLVPDVLWYPHPGQSQIVQSPAAQGTENKSTSEYRQPFSSP